MPEVIQQAIVAILFTDLFDNNLIEPSEKGCVLGSPENRIMRGCAHDLCV